MSNRFVQTRTYAVMIVATMVGLVGCSSSAKTTAASTPPTGDSSATSSSGSPTSASSGSPASASTESSASAPTGADAAAAAVATTKTYTDKPSPFPVSAPLPKPFPVGKKFGYLQCAAPVCAQLAPLMEAGVKALGGTFLVVKGGASTQQLQSAFSSLLAQKPDALLLPGIEPDSVAPQLAQAKAAGIPMTSTGIMDIKKYGIDASAFGQPLAVLVGRLQADWVVANKSDRANTVFYTTPELDFFGPEEVAYRAELTKVCPGCSVRTVKVPISTYSSTAPALIVSDLQSHPKTTIAVFGANDPTTGLVAAMKAAGLKTPYIGFGPTPSNLTDIKNGDQVAGLGLDYPAIAWTMVDEAARLIEKAPLSGAESQSLVPVQWLTSSNLHGDIAQGWTGYPDYAARFKKLWNVK